MKSLVFDAGPIITLTLNNLMWTLEPLKKEFRGHMQIPEAVRKELIDRPLEINRFKFEALHTLRFIREGILSVHPATSYQPTSEKLMELANNMFYTRRKTIQVVHIGEIEVLALALESKASAVVIDERTSIELIENPENIRKRLSNRLHTRVSIDKKRLAEFKELTKRVRVIRSAELMIAAYELGYLDPYLPEEPYDIGILLDAVLWGLKLNGCTLSKEEIESLVRLEMQNPTSSNS